MCRSYYLLISEVDTEKGSLAIKVIMEPHNSTMYIHIYGPGT